MRVIESADYQQLIKADDPCIHCNSGEPLKRCHQLDMEGVLSRWHHPDGEMCARCPFCVLLPAVTQVRCTTTVCLRLVPRASARSKASNATAECDCYLPLRS